MAWSRFFLKSVWSVGKLGDLWGGAGRDASMPRPMEQCNTLKLVLMKLVEIYEIGEMYSIDQFWEEKIVWGPGL